MIKDGTKVEIVHKLLEHDKKFESIDKRFNRIDRILQLHSDQLSKLTEKVDQIDERTKPLSKIYEAIKQAIH
jgi:archaellum component FlaC